MENTLNFITSRATVLKSLKQQEKDRWQQIIYQAFEKMKQDKKKKYLPTSEEFNKRDKKAKTIEEWNTIGQWYNREIVKLYLGEKYLEFEPK